MKNVKFLFLFALTSIISVATIAQKPFVGTINYKFDYQGEIDPMQKAQMPSSFLLAFNESKCRTEVKSDIFMMAYIVDYKTKDVLFLLEYEMMGVKNAAKTSIEKMKAEFVKAEYKNPEIKYIDETKTILGYKCKKAEILEDGEVGAEMYYTEEINVPKDILLYSALQLPYFDFVILELTTFDDDVVMKCVATSIDTKKPKANLFVMPADFELQKEKTE